MNSSKTINVQPVIDFNTLSKGSVSGASSAVSQKGSWWPFSWFTKRPVEPVAEESNVVASPLDEVIAMKRRDDDFIDIQVRKLSYAEVASLKPTQAVVVEENELEKSVMDRELLTEFKKRPKFDREELLSKLDEQQAATVVVDHQPEDDFEEDYYPTKKTPKRLNKHNNRNRPKH